MDKVLYMVLDEGETLKQIMRENQVEVLTGDGTLNEEYLARCTVMIPGKIHFTREILDKASKLKFICKYGVGMDRIDLEACRQKHIYVANTPTANYVSVAEHALTLMMALAKQIYPYQLYLRRTYPEYSSRYRYRPVELKDKTIAIIGMGNIGRYMASLAKGIGMKVIGYDPYPRKDLIPDYVELKDTLQQALIEADCVSLHVAGVEANRHLIGREELHQMKQTAFLINTTRGFVVDEQALYEALKAGEIAGAGLDVFTEEPICPGNPLMFLENVIATPHIAANTPEAHKRAELQAAQNILDFFDGKQPQFLI